jgi:hypothetical protein
LARCPQCNQSVELNAGRCGSCIAVFNNKSGWRPVPENASEAAGVQLLYPDAGPTLVGAVGEAVVRIFLSVLALAGFWVVTLLSAIPYGGGNRELAALTSTLTFFMFGWSLLPLVRYSRIAAIVVGLAWAGLGLWLLPAPGLAAWVAATVGLGFCLAKSPPVFWVADPKSRSADG